MAEKKKSSNNARTRKDDAVKADTATGAAGEDNLETAQKPDTSTEESTTENVSGKDEADAATPSDKAIRAEDLESGSNTAEQGAVTAADTQDSSTQSDDDVVPDTDAEPTGDDRAAGNPSENETVATPTGTEPLDDSAAPALVPVTPTSEPKSGFWPMVLGGVIAAGIGAGTAYYVLPKIGVLGVPEGTFRDDVTGIHAAQSQKIEEQSAEIETLRNEIAKAREAAEAATGAGGSPDLTAIEDTQSDLQTQLAALSDQISGLQSKMTALESRPISGGSSVSQSEINDLQQMLETQSEALAMQQTEIAALSADAAEQEAAAVASASAALRRAALTRIRTALDTGTGFTGALDDLEATGQEVPDALRAVAAEGVPSMASLQDAFPPAARLALADARKELGESGEGQGGVMAFLSDQLGARSLEPREGDDPDAVLSRAEFALHEARLGDALAEIATLPATGQAALAGWVENARTRMNATRAVDALSAEIN
ncbi:COG4223 family protein [Roseovarius pelagicus]|uniref:Mitochondrial inner membrane protein n=1 Tax=Roseovarius pelagicus TaxID=2980108 RepID=A0ABY6D9A8_9RHOB|nr:hypothetical protein [Roseovarius pelagicus]UXX82690.1 hypothetical protein N7U68_16615 [Roseovarius pelagicus]